MPTLELMKLYSLILKTVFCGQKLYFVAQKTVFSLIYDIKFNFKCSLKTVFWQNSPVLVPGLKTVLIQENLYTLALLEICYFIHVCSYLYCI